MAPGHTIRYPNKRFIYPEYFTNNLLHLFCRVVVVFDCPWFVCGLLISISLCCNSFVCDVAPPTLILSFSNWFCDFLIGAVICVSHAMVGTSYSHLAIMAPKARVARKARKAGKARKARTARKAKKVGGKKRVAKKKK